MGAPRKPTAILELNGAYKKNPNRKRGNEPKINKLVGRAPKYFDKEQRAMWAELKRALVKGVVLLSDKFSLELLCNSLVQYRRDPFSFTAADKAQLKAMLSAFGMTPNSRAGIEVPKAKEENEFDEFVTYGDM